MTEESPEQEPTPIEEVRQLLREALAELDAQAAAVEAALDALDEPADPRHERKGME